MGDVGEQNVETVISKSGVDKKQKEVVMKKASLSVCGWVRNRFGQAGHAALRPHSCCSAAGTSGVKGRIFSAGIVAVLVYFFVGGTAHATSGTNTTTGVQTANWSALTWTGGTPNAVGDTAGFSFTGDQNITLNQNLTLGRLECIGTGQLNLLRSGVNTLTFDNTTAGAVASVLQAKLTAGQTTARTLQCNLILNSDLIVTMPQIQARIYGVWGIVTGAGRLSCNFGIAPTEGPDTGVTPNLGPAPKLFQLGNAGDAVSSYTGGTDLRADSASFATTKFYTKKVDALGTGTTAGRLYMDKAGLDLNTFNQTVGGLSGGGNNSSITDLGASGTTIISNCFPNTKGPFTFSGVISNGANRVIALVKSGTGTQTFTGANTYSGGTDLNNGTLSFANGSLGSTGNITFSGSSTLQWVGGNTQDISSRIQAIGSGITATLDIAGASDTVTLGTGLSGSGSFEKNGAGTLVFSVGNTYGGGTTISAGKLQLSGAANRLPTGTAITLADVSGAVLDLNSQNQTISSLAGGGSTGGNVTLGSGTLTVGNATDTVYAGGISGATGNLIKQGAGKLTLSSGNSYGGATTITTGTLALGSSGGIANTTSIDVQSGTVLDVSAVSGGITLGSSQLLKGNGTVTGNMKVNGTVEPGASIGALTVTGDLELSGTAAIQVTSPTVKDRIIVSGAMKYGGSLTVTELNGPLTEGIYDLFDFTSQSGTFTTINLPTPVGGRQWHDFGAGVLFDYETGSIKLDAASSTVAPTLLTPTVNLATIGLTTATLGATLEDNGGDTITSYGTAWGTSTLPEGNQLGIAGSPGTEPVAFTQDRDSLPSATKIYARGWASNSVGIAFTPTEVTFYTEPTAASVAGFASVQATTMTVNWTSGNGNGRIVVMKQGSAVTHIPTDGTDYTASAAFRGGQNLGDDEFVVYKGTGSSVPVTGLTRDTTYHVAVYEYIADGAERNYQQDTPAAASQKTSTSVPVLTLTTANTIDMTTATLSATINDDGADTITSYGTVWGTESQPTANELDIVATPSPLPYVFTQSRDSLPSATLIYARGWASNSVGIAYSLETSFYTEPSAASNVSFSLVTNNSMTVSWDNGNGGGRIVVMKQGGAVAGTPSDGTNYTANAVFHSGSTIASGEYVVYAGSGNSVTVSGLGRGTTYYVAVFEYAGSAALINYQQDTPATGIESTVWVPMDFTYDGTDDVNMDWNNPTNYIGDVSFPDGAGDRLFVVNTTQANAYKLNGNRTLSAFIKAAAGWQNTQISPGSVPDSVLTWDTGVEGSNALFHVRGASATTPELRCGTYVNMYLKSSLVWDGSSDRADRTSTNGVLCGVISGPGKLTVKWYNSNGVTNFLDIVGGAGPNVHQGGTEFQRNNLGISTTRAAFRLNKQHATGDGDTTVGPQAEIYLVTNVVATGGAISDTTKLYLQTDGTNYAKVELANDVDETVDSLYLWSPTKAAYVLQPPGTYGSTSSGATYKNDVWFGVSGSGILRVKNGMQFGTLIKFY